VSLLKELAEKIWHKRIRVDHRTPRLYVHPVKSTSVWCIGHQGTIEIFQFVFDADLNHDHEKQTIVIMDAYPKGMQSQIQTMSPVRVPPTTMIREQINALVLAFRVKRGKPFSTRFVLVDQFQRKHETQKISFTWVGSPQSEESNFLVPGLR
jgi:hypothetical protein